MNNNRGSNRRRGRGNNRSQGGNQTNRIDSRARGNAPQLLEKYKKLAHDASLNGDRVQSEYYLQFADHYFRVLADSRTAKDEQQRPRHQGDRDAASDDDFRDDDDEPSPRAPRETGRETGREAGRENGRDGRRDRPNDGPREREDGERDNRQEDSDEEFESPDNPFTRPRPAESERPSRARRARPKDGAVEGPREDEGPRFDPASLPPAFGAVQDEERPRRKPRRARAATSEKGDDRGGEELETVD